jgi:UPF0176 protein
VNFKVNISSPPVVVAAFYKFAPFVDPAALRPALLKLCSAHRVKGTILLAAEGINGTIAGTQAAIDQVAAHISALPGCAALNIKYSSAATMPFHRLKVHIKAEIVTMGQPGIDPLASAGQYISPEDWNALISDAATIVIDTRNDYEVAVGSFPGAINPNTKSFRDFPDWFRAERHRLLENGTEPKIAMFCTGGIRCEKSTAFLKSEGVEQVYHLQGGILKYLETVPAAQSLWQGECFVFDSRVTVAHGLATGTYRLCYGCRRPVSATDQASPLYEEGVSCPACHAERTDEQRCNYRERHHQERLATQRGQMHVGAVLPRNDD